MILSCKNDVCSGTCNKVFLSSSKEQMEQVVSLQVELISSRCTHHKTAPETKLS
jgi:hypothetical protein